MAQIEQSDKGKKKKGAQKKMHIHVDFTPMVDMNMLLITFFMLCTTMIKSQTLKIALPTNEETENLEQATKVSEKDAVTLLLDSELNDEGKVIGDVIYYYTGKPQVDAEGNVIKDQLVDKKLTFLNDSIDVANNNARIARGIRAILAEQNSGVLKSIDSLKQLWRDNQLGGKTKAENDSIYEAKAKDIRGDNNRKQVIVVIKPTPKASWASLISALDEMSINEISRYQIDPITIDEWLMMGKDPNDPDAPTTKLIMQTGTSEAK